MNYLKRNLKQNMRATNRCKYSVFIIIWPWEGQHLYANVARLLLRVFCVNISQTDPEVKTLWTWLKYWDRRTYGQMEGWQTNRNNNSVFLYSKNNPAAIQLCINDNNLVWTTFICSFKIVYFPGRIVTISWYLHTMWSRAAVMLWLRGRLVTKWLRIRAPT